MDTPSSHFGSNGEHHDGGTAHRGCSGFIPLDHLMADAGFEMVRCAKSDQKRAEHHLTR